MPACVHLLSLLLCKNETTSDCVFFLFRACIDRSCHYFSLHFCFLFQKAKLHGLALLCVCVSACACLCVLCLLLCQNEAISNCFFLLSFVIMLIADVIVFLHFCFIFQKAKLSKDDVTPTEDYSLNSKGLKKENSKVCIACFFAGVEGVVVVDITCKGRNFEGVVVVNIRCKGRNFEGVVVVDIRCKGRNFQRVVVVDIRCNCKGRTLRSGGGGGGGWHQM